MITIERGLVDLDVHFQASPKGCAGLVIPGINDTAAHMFSFRGRLVGAGGLLDIDGEFLFGSAKRRSRISTQSGRRGKQVSFKMQEWRT